MNAPGRMPPPYGRRERLTLVAVLSVVAFAHLASFLFFKHLDATQPVGPPYPIVGGDAVYYARVAQHLLQYQVFTDSPADLAPTNANLPAYPFLLAVTKGITGSFTPLVLLQVIVALVGVFLIHVIGRRFVPWQVALIPATLYGIEPMAVLANTALLTDGLFAALLIVLTYIGFIQDRVIGWRRAAVVGLMVGFLALLRPTGEMLVPIVLFFFVLKEWLHAGGKSFRPAFVSGLVAFLCVSAVIAPWIMRNHTYFGRYEIFHSGSHVMLDYDVRSFLAWRELQSQGTPSVYYPARHLEDPVYELIDARIKAALAEMTPLGEDPENYVGSLALRFMLHDPIRYAYFHLAHVPIYLFGSGIAAYDQFARMELSGGGLSESTLYKVVTALNAARDGNITPTVWWAGLIVLEVAVWMAIAAFAALALVVKRRHFLVWFFAALIAYFALITGPLTVARYRIPAEPFLLMMAAIGVYTAVSQALFAYRMRKAGVESPEQARFIRFVRYFATGVTIFLVNVVSYSLLVRAGVWYIAAIFVSFFCGFIASFVLQKFFAFRDQQGPGRGRQIGLYLMLFLLNLITNTAIIVFFVNYIGTHAVVGILVSNVIIAAWNFFIYDCLLFTERELHLPELPSTLSGDCSDISVVIPCYNEEESIGTVLDSMPARIGEVIVVDNNSSDRTAAIAAAHGAHVIREQARGYGAAVKAGIRASSGSIIAILDGDNQHPAGELPRMLHTLESEKLDFISGARFPLSDHWLRGFGNWGLTLIVNIFFRLSLTDSQSGMVLFRRPFWGRIEPKNSASAFVQELKIRAATADRRRFAECRIPYIAREKGVSKLMPIRHGARILVELIALRFTLRSRE